MSVVPWSSLIDWMDTNCQDVPGSTGGETSVSEQPANATTVTSSAGRRILQDHTVRPGRLVSSCSAILSR